MSFVDNLAAGDEVDAVAGELEQIQRQLESLGATGAPKPMGHIFVPRDRAAVALPAGKATIDFAEGRLTHEDLGVVLDDLVTVTDLVEDASSRQPELENIIFHADTVASLGIGNESQSTVLQNVPIPQGQYNEVQVELAYPGEVTVLASTQRLPIGLGAVTVNGQRHGEVSGTLDAKTEVPVSPFSLWDEFDGQYAEAPVYTAFYDQTTITVDNTGANSIDVEIQAKESQTSDAAEWRTIETESIPGGDNHSLFPISARHKLLRTRITNSTNGDSVSATVEYNMANP